MSDKYIALTGATGLLGSYLLKDLLAAGQRVVVLVRGSRMDNARGRIETVLDRFETELGYHLPRPVVIESDLGSENLGLTDESANWMRRHVDTFLHNAASLEFLYNEKTGEPFRSNVSGTENVIALCRTCGIRRFHQVSTAYVCGLRDGVVMENELFVGQDFGNAYEQSKCESEEAVQRSGVFDSVTVFRPAIIVGDSKTGYTPTFHGFYTPLKILYPLIDANDTSPEGVRELLHEMGLNFKDEKNFVPVDWISQVITHIIGRASLHGKRYHLAPSNRTRIDTLCDILIEALAIPKSRDVIHAPNTGNASSLVETFLSQMNVYRAYWRNDPVFDMTNTMSAAGHIPCPPMNPDRMRTLTKYAVTANFGWPKPRPVLIPFDPAKILNEIVEKQEATKRDAAGTELFALEISGLGGGAWTFRNAGNCDTNITLGLPESNPPTARLNVRTLQTICEKDNCDVNLFSNAIYWENADDEWVVSHEADSIRKLIDLIKQNRR